MTGNTQKNVIRNALKTKFIRSILLWMIVIFLVIILSVITIVSFFFTSEINKSIVTEKQKQLEMIESTITKRMEEVSSIAYNLSVDSSLYMETVPELQYSAYEINQILRRYLGGNDFIEHLVYYRLSEPDIVHASSGELTFEDFWSTYLNFQNDTAADFRSRVTETTGIQILPVMTGKNNRSYFTYVSGVPQFSSTPQAFIVMMIPVDNVQTILETQLNNCFGTVAIYDIAGNPIYETGNLNGEALVEARKNRDEGTFFWQGKKYLVQKTVSSGNNWTYISTVRLNDIESEVVYKQLIFIAVLVILMMIAIAAMLICIAFKYKPIMNLILNYADMPEKDSESGVIDEESLLTNTLTVLKDDSEQKQKYEAAYHEAEAANKAKSEFFSMMSHDIRTPMNTIVGMTEIAGKNMDDPKYVMECLQNVRVASHYLLDIINNVLDMSRIESGKFTLSEDVIELPKFIYEVITIINHNIEVKSQKLIVDVEHIKNEKFIGDYVRLTQVFMNILSNAIKFTPNGGTIHLSLRQEKSMEPGYGDYVFIFRDTGIGMSPEFVSKVFETFSRDEGSGIAKVEGTGLGMAIAKNFVEFMGGTIRCESEQGKGTTFTIRMHRRLAEDAVEPVKFPEEYRKKRVLIIGNEERHYHYQKQLFSEFGVDNRYVNNVEEAAAAVKEAEQNERQFDFVIINQSMTDTNGIKTVKKLRGVSGKQEITFVLAARDLFAVQKSEAYDTGISQFVQRPLFRSTILGIFNREFELSTIREKPDIINLEGKRILIAEDSKINMKIARAFINETGAEVVEATNGKEAVTAFKSHPAGYFDLILMDVQMPVMNGYEATASIRSVEREDALTIPIYAMTANTFDEDVRQVKEIGMNGHLGKPYDAYQLFNLLQKAIG